MTHIPVLTKEVIKYLDPKPNENFIDCTLGNAGHSKLILEKTSPQGKVLGVDFDPQQIKNNELLMTGSRGRLILINDSYANLQEIVATLRVVSQREKKIHFNGILLDLGMSSDQLEESKRGFSFQKDEVLDMRYNPEVLNLTAEGIINNWSEQEIEKILKEYGEEKFTKQIAKKIIEERRIKKIATTLQLVEIIKKAIPLKFQHGRIHCATRTLQALRVAVNDELNNLIKVLPQAISILRPGGRIVVISFHSLEDRIVKNFLKEKEKDKTAKILTKKPVVASLEEIKINPASRSAKLRAIVKI